MKNSFVLYTDYRQHIELLSVNEKAQLLDALFKYADGEEVELEGMALMAFSFIRAQMDRDNEKYEKTCQRRREAGAKGGRANAKQNEAKQANASFAKQAQANQADTDTDNDTDKDIKEKESKKKSADKPHRSFTPPTLEEVRAYCAERKNNVDAQRFMDFYESKGWFVGKNKMKDWKAAVRTWEQRSRGQPKDSKIEIDPKFREAMRSSEVVNFGI